jgi:hypothetical protein
VPHRDRARTLGRGERFADADERPRPSASRARDDRLTVGVEGGVGEVGVAVDEREQTMPPEARTAARGAAVA